MLIIVLEIRQILGIDFLVHFAKFLFVSFFRFLLVVFVAVDTEGEHPTDGAEDNGRDRPHKCVHTFMNSRTRKDCVECQHY